VRSFFDAGVVGGGGGYDVVELHDDVGADGILERYGVFRGEEPSGEMNCISFWRLLSLMIVSSTESERKRTLECHREDLET
jgi:hypothetical protein